MYVGLSVRMCNCRRMKEKRCRRNGGEVIKYANAVSITGLCQSFLSCRGYRKVGGGRREKRS